MRRWLLCLLLLPLARVGLAQLTMPISLLASDGNLYGANESGFYSYSPITGQQTVLNGTGLSALCLERSDGTLLGIVNYDKSATAEDVTLAGVITPIASFPAGSTVVCPALANDGNYYGTSTTGGDYSYGYIYQLTAAGEINVLFNFTGGDDGDPSYDPPIQASDGNLYWYADSLLQRYSSTAGLTTLTLPYDACCGPSLLEASDGNLYSAGTTGVLQITFKGATKVIYSPPAQDGGNEDGYISNLYFTSASAAQPLAALVQYDYVNYDPNDGCNAQGNYYQMLPLSLSGTLGTDYFDIGVDEYYYGDVANSDDYSLTTVLGGNGTIYAAYTDDNQQDGGTTAEGFCNAIDTYTNYDQAYPTGTVPIQVALSQTHVKPGGSATVTWQVNNAYSDTMQQCFGFNGLSGKLPLSGSATVTAAAAGTYTPAIVCGGTETGFATLVAGNAVLTLGANATQVSQNATVTLTAKVTNPGTPAPTGKVNFMVGSTVIGTAALANSQATFTASTTGVTPGTYQVIASYAGDTNYGPATSTGVSLTVVAKAVTALSLTPASQSVMQDGTATVTATVTGNSPLGAPTGSVKFMTGATTIGTVALTAKSSTTSTAKLSALTTGIAAGSYPVTASYGGDSNDLPSSSNSVTVIVTAGTPVSLAISPNPVASNASFALTATITGKDSPSGTVSFYANGTQDLASANVTNGSGQVTLPAGTLAAGTYQITAQYAGDANNPKGTSPAVSFTVQ